MAMRGHPPAAGALAGRDAAREAVSAGNSPASAAKRHTAAKAALPSLPIMKPPFIPYYRHD
jgi:hypothetical protein